jgi:exodeoxyribonuclease VII large subunit
MSAQIDPGLLDSDAVPGTGGNLAPYTVGELARAVKRTIEGSYGLVRVRGELLRVKRHTSGHIYLCLKDDDAVIDGVVWRSGASRLGMVPEDGVEVICTGRLTTYPARSSYQLVIESMELAGQGALLKLIEERRKKLAAEGLFAAERKRPLPSLPRVIGVVTSPTGAVIRDILHRLADRFPCPAHRGLAVPPGRADRRARRRRDRRSDGLQ